jgi:hypothetical protein
MIFKPKDELFLVNTAQFSQMSDRSDYFAQP